MSLIKIKAGNYEFIAKLEEEKAPKTCEVFKKLLPLSNKTIHCRWCGEAVWVPLDDMELENENHTTYPSKGEILFYPGGSIGAELLLPYGSCVFTSKVGNLSGNHFLTIISNLEKLEKLGGELLENGAVDITFEEFVDANHPATTQFVTK